MSCEDRLRDRENPVSPSFMPRPIGSKPLWGKDMRPELLYVLVQLAAAAHAVWNALVKRAADALLMMAAIRRTVFSHNSPSSASREAKRW
jgi:hypothetical protein